jgi:ADP-heptose:LPS heptosyltransferase
MPDPKRILVIGLSNIGDAVLMSPVIEALRSSYPFASITLFCGERAKAVFEDDPRIKNILGIEEFSGLLGRIRLLASVWKMRPDILVDLRYRALILFFRPWRLFKYLLSPPPNIKHMKMQHLWRLSRQAGLSFSAETVSNPLSISSKTKEYVQSLLDRWGLDARKRLAIVCAGAKSPIKRWNSDRFAAVCDFLIEDMGCEVILTGEVREANIINEILESMKRKAHSAVGSTTVLQTAALMQKAFLVITNDSASLHLACAVGAKVLAIFGPTDPAKYGPTGKDDRAIHRRLFCSPCEKATCRYSHECMRFIPIEEVCAAAKEMLK